ncbi:MAG: alpha-L-rhamnosidase N-terminal domain-containing protein [Cytophagaceae bacterium]|nr:alpha-L-rhamnosidase N-terminal domain-containing protein [Cytophagaceae bacterium]
MTARGIYGMYLNGKRVSDEYFNPGLTQYNKHQQYQTLILPLHFKQVENAIGAWLSKGRKVEILIYSGEAGTISVTVNHFCPKLYYL